jgi:hypothetical protein
MGHWERIDPSITDPRRVQSFILSSPFHSLCRPSIWQLSNHYKMLMNREEVEEVETMMTMVVEENRPRRRTSTSVSPGNGSVDLACDSDLNLDKPTVINNSNFTQQQWSAVATVLVLASLLLFTLYISAERWNGARSHIGEFLAGTSDEAAGIPSLGILLHPEEHRSRDAGIITLHWTITSGFRTPDGVRKKVYLINGNFCIS